MTGIAIESDLVGQLAATTSRLRLAILDLRETLYALQRDRRTPNDIRLMIERARVAVYRSQAIRRQLDEHFRIH